MLCDQLTGADAMAIPTIAAGRRLPAILRIWPLLTALAVVCGAAPVIAQDRPVAGPSGDTAAAALQALCMQSDTSPKSVLARADHAGWLSARPQGVTSWDVARNRALQIGSATLFVDAWTISSAAGREDSCSIGVRGSTTGWVAAAKRLAGVAPSIVLGPTATFYLIRIEGGWRPATADDQPSTSKAMTSGSHYNLMAADGLFDGHEEAPGILMLNHFRPPESASSTRLSR